MPMSTATEEEKNSLFHNTPENIASFIGSRPFVDQMILTTPMDELIMNTMGNFDRPVSR